MFTGLEDVSLRERIVRLGPPGCSASPPSRQRTDAPWIVLVNVAAEPHIGPGRRWVEYARDWAALGFRCVRFDQSGLGNSPTCVGQREDVVFDAHWLDDLPEVIDALAEPRPPASPAPVAIFGLCSGAYSAFEAAVRRPVDAIYAVNPRVSLPEMSRVGQRVHDDAARSPVPCIAVRSAGRTPFYLAWGIWRIFRQFTFWHAPMASVCRCCEAAPPIRSSPTARTPRVSARSPGGAWCGAAQSVGRVGTQLPFTATSTTR